MAPKQPDAYEPNLAVVKNEAAGVQVVKMAYQTVMSALPVTIDYFARKKSQPSYRHSRKAGAI